MVPSLLNPLGIVVTGRVALHLPPQHKNASLSLSLFISERANERTLVKVKREEEERDRSSQVRFK